MNLFYLDEDLDKCAEYHVDKHVNKMILEAAQLINTNLWIDHLFGFVPRPITKEENAVLQTTRKYWKDFPMEERPSRIFLLCRITLLVCGCALP